MRMNYSENFEEAIETALRMAADVESECTEPDNDQQTRLILGLEGGRVMMIHIRDLDRRRRTRRCARIQKKVQRFRKAGCIRWAALLQLRWAVEVDALSPAGKARLDELGPAASPDRIPALIVEITNRDEFCVWGAYRPPIPGSDRRFGPFRRLNPELGDLRLREVFRWLTQTKARRRS
jgi:hypothetical protein